jgi:hypothetical protein
MDGKCRAKVVGITRPPNRSAQTSCVPKSVSQGGHEMRIKPLFFSSPHRPSPPALRAAGLSAWPLPDVVSARLCKPPPGESARDMQTAMCAMRFFDPPPTHSRRDAHRRRCSPCPRFLLLPCCQSCLSTHRPFHDRKAARLPRKPVGPARQSQCARRSRFPVPDPIIPRCYCS